MTPASLWRNRSFLALWWGQAVSEVGSQVSFIAVPLTAIVVLHTNAFATGLLGTFQFAPFLLFGLPVGVWVDRWPRRWILIVADCGRLLALGSIPVVASLGVLTLAQLYAVGFAVGTLTVFFDVAYQSFLPALVEGDQLTNANSKLTFTQSASEIAGPGLGGALVGLAGPARAVIADALSYLVSVISLLMVRSAREEVPHKSERRALRVELMEGLRYVLGHRILRLIAGCTGTWHFFSGGTNAIVLVYAVRELHLTPAQIGLWFALGSLGALPGAALAEKVIARFGIGTTIRVSAIMGGWPWVLVPLAQPPNPLPLLITSGVLGSLFGVGYDIAQVSLRQAITPHRLQGRMNATMRFLIWGTLPIGAFAGGLAGQLIGLRPALFVGAGGILLASAWVIGGPVPRVRRPDDAIPPPAVPAAEGLLPGEPRRSCR